MRLPRLLATALALVVCSALPAPAQGTVIPDNATVQCNDGSWSRAASQRGACSRHKGVKQWIGRRPNTASARCNDGSYWLNATPQGACSSHGGVYRSYDKARKDERKEMQAEHKMDKKERRAERKMDKMQRKDERKEDRKSKP
jgi:hypothetical protein